MRVKRESAKAADLWSVGSLKASQKILSASYHPAFLPDTTVNPTGSQKAFWQPIHDLMCMNRPEVEASRQQSQEIRTSKGSETGQTQTALSASLAGPLASPAQPQVCEGCLEKESVPKHVDSLLEHSSTAQRRFPSSTCSAGCSLGPIAGLIGTVLCYAMNHDASCDSAC